MNFLRFFVPLLFLATPLLHADDVIYVTADSTLRGVLPELTQAWADNQSGMRVELQLANADNIRKLLVGGKGGDVVILADLGEAKTAAKNGFLMEDSLKTVARNELIIYGRKPLLADEELEWYDLLEREWEHFAMGNPELTWSGRAAQAAILKHGMGARIKGEGVHLGGNEAVTLDFARHGEADAVFILRTDLNKTLIEGFMVHVIDAADYPPFFYVAGVPKTSHSASAAHSFIDSLTSKEAVQIWKKAGFNTE
jgi:molybdenum ABC transporter molybdate-binding protein